MTINHLLLTKTGISTTIIICDSFMHSMNVLTLTLCVCAVHILCPYDYNKFSLVQTVIMILDARWLGQLFKLDRTGNKTLNRWKMSSEVATKLIAEFFLLFMPLVCVSLKMCAVSALEKFIFCGLIDYNRRKKIIYVILLFL